MRALKDFQKIPLENQLKIRQAVRELGVAPMDYPTSNPHLSTLKKVAKALQCLLESLLPSS